MESWQYGLIDHWNKQNMPQPDRKCADYRQQSSELPRISLANLSGAFVLLLVGWSLAIFAFIVEKIVHYHKLNRNIHNQ